MALPICYNIPPLEGSSRAHAATLPAASLASAIQNTSVKYTEVTALWFLFANASKISSQRLMLNNYIHVKAIFLVPCPLAPAH